MFKVFTKKLSFMEKRFYINDREKLKVNDYIIGASGEMLILQEDGNLVLYESFVQDMVDDSGKKIETEIQRSRYALWCSDTNGSNINYVELDGGNLKIYNNDGKIIWKTDNKLETDIVCFIDFGEIIFAKKIGDRRILTPSNGPIDTFSMDSPFYTTNVCINNDAFRERINNEMSYPSYQIRSKIFPNRNIKKYSSSLILIGSLFWQNDGNIPGDNARKIWRNNSLDMNNDTIKSIDFPIVYGRSSNSNIYTMCVVKKETNGKAKIVKLKNNLLIKSEIYKEVISLSKAEGMYKNKINSLIAIKDFKPWAIIGYKFGKTADEDLKRFIRNRWRKEINGDKVLSDLIIRTRSVIDENGEIQLEINSPNEFDIIFCTIPLPDETIPNRLLIRDKVKSDNTRYYFFNTLRNGIKTHLDDKILDEIEWISSKSFTLLCCQYIQSHGLMLIFSTKGSLILYNKDTSTLLWESPIGQSGDKAVFQDDGNLVIYENNIARWASNTCYIQDENDNLARENISKDILLELYNNQINIMVNRKINYHSHSHNDEKLSQLSWTNPILENPIINYI